MGWVTVRDGCKAHMKVPAGSWTDGGLLPEVLVICHARLRGVVCEEHAHNGLVLCKLQGPAGFIRNGYAEVAVPCFQPRSEISYRATTGRFVVVMAPGVCKWG